MRMTKFITAALLAGTAFVSAASACSTFLLESGRSLVVGKNYDWDIGDALVVVNKRGVTKTALSTDKPMKWTSRYGSVSFNQYGREQPNGGMNEVGLVVEIMWLDETVYPKPDARPSLENLQWVQYQLDCSSTVGEVIRSGDHMRITPEGHAKVHFLVCDAAGDCVTIEFLGGKTVVHTGKTLPHPVLTNDTYECSIGYAKEHAGFGGSRPVANTTSSLDRFVRAAGLISSPTARSAGDAVAYAFATLDSVSQGSQTQWRIVYDLRAMRVHFKTLANGRARYLDLGALDYDCRTPVLVLDIDADLRGDVTGSLRPYTTAANRALIARTFRQTDFLAELPDQMLDAFARYPEMTACESAGAHH
jgi:penicillin V acylase-like amidase (Ntn superfamily)